MRLLLLNPPHPAIGSRIPKEHLPPLSLLALGGPLLDAGHEVELLDADLAPLAAGQVLRECERRHPDAILLGHSGSTSAHPVVCDLARQIRVWLPHTWTIYGGVYPTFHWRKVLEEEPAIDVVVRGEGEETVVKLINALEQGTALEEVPGLAFRAGTVSGRQRTEPPATASPARATSPAPPVRNLDSCRVGWELIDPARYSYWGGRRAVVVQFSRGCPHRCSYCGQRGFWPGWRHRDPEAFAAELASLRRRQGVEVINFADENPTASRPAWRAFLEAMIREDAGLILVGSTRAGDIVRDADILHLYRRAGVARLLLGIESTDEATLERIRKGSSRHIDREAIQLLREHGIISMAAWVTGFAEETDADYWRLLRQLLAYDPDQIQGLYATPHAWTPFAQEERNRRVIQTDLRKWDYKHQVLAGVHVPNWRALVWMKTIEAVMQLRPRAWWRMLTHPDPAFRAAMRWYYSVGRRVWPYEIWQWLFADRRIRHGPSLEAFQGAWDNAWPKGSEPGGTRVEAGDSAVTPSAA